MSNQFILLLKFVFDDNLLLSLFFSDCKLATFKLAILPIILLINKIYWALAHVNKIKIINKNSINKLA